jgi:hypothetical protein
MTILRRRCENLTPTQYPQVISTPAPTQPTTSTQIPEQFRRQKKCGSCGNKNLR